MYQRNSKNSKKRNRQRAVKVLGILLLSMFLLFQFTHTAKSEAVANYEKIVVCSGDTLWSIASQYIDDNQDVRKMVYEIKKLNNLTSAVILPGQELVIPCD